MPPTSVTSPPRGAPRQGVDRPRDAGLGLVEIVAAVTLMSIVVVGVFQAAIVSIRSSTFSVRNAQTLTVLQNAADRLHRADLACDNNAYTQYVQAAALAAGWPAGQASVSTDHFIAPTKPTLEGSWEAGTCAGTEVTEHLVQRLTITVTSPQGGITRSMQVVKADV